MLSSKMTTDRSDRFFGLIIYKISWKTSFSIELLRIPYKLPILPGYPILRLYSSSPLLGSPLPYSDFRIFTGLGSAALIGWSCLPICTVLMQKTSVFNTVPREKPLISSAHNYFLIAGWSFRFISLFFETYKQIQHEETNVFPFALPLRYY